MLNSLPFSALADRRPGEDGEVAGLQGHCVYPMDHHHSVVAMDVGDHTKMENPF